MHRRFQVPAEVALVSLGTWSQAIGQIGFALLTTRWLQLESRGMVIVILGAANLIAVVASSGLDVEGRRQLTRRPSTAHSYLLASHASAFLGAILGLGFGGLLMAIERGPSNGPEVVMFLGFACATQVYVLVLRSGGYGLGRYLQVSLALLLGAAVQLLGPWVLHRSSALTLGSAMGTFLLGQSLSAAAILFTVRRAPASTTPRMGRSVVAQSLRLKRSSWPSTGGPLAQQYARGADRLILAAVAGTGATAIYGAASSLSSVLLMLTLPASQVIMTRTSGDPTRDLRTLAAASLLPVVALAGVLWIAAPEAIQLIFGPGYEPAVTVTRISSLTVIASSAFTLRLARMQGMGEHARVNGNAVLGCAVTTVLVVTLGHSLGAVGAASAMLASTAAMALFWPRLPNLSRARSRPTQGVKPRP